MADESNTERRTVWEVWRQRVSAAGKQPAFLVEQGGRWSEIGWREAGERVDALAAGFLALGVERGDRAAVLCRTRLEWVLCDLALISVGAVVVPVYPTSAAVDVVHVLSDSGARLLVCENEEAYAPVERARSELWSLEHVVAIEGFPGADLSLDELDARGRGRLGAGPAELDAVRAQIREDDLLTCVYTSGTTGPPKGCMLTHRNYGSMVDMISRVGLVEPGDRTVLHLPLAHVFARLVEFLAPRAGLTIAFCPDSSGLAGALRAVRPTVFPTVPKVYETLYRTVRARFEETTGARRRLVEWALAVGREAALRRQADERLRPRLRLERALADQLVFSKVRAPGRETAAGDLRGRRSRARSPSFSLHLASSLSRATA